MSDDAVPSKSREHLKNRKPTGTTSQGIKIVNEENDFEFSSLSFIRVGSAHQVCEPIQDQENADLLERIINHLMRQYEPAADPQQVVIQHK